MPLNYLLGIGEKAFNIYNIYNIYNLYILYISKKTTFGDHSSM